MAVPPSTDDADGRRRRGLILAGIVLVIGVPATLYAWLSDRNADQEAAELAEDLRIAGRLVDDVGELWGRELTSAWAGDPGPLDEALGHGDSFQGAMFDDGAISAAYEVRWGLTTRCVLLLLRDDEVRTDILDSNRCSPRAP